MAAKLSVEERIKRSQQFGSKTQAMPSVNQLAGQVGITPGTTATTAGPLATPDQRKMMGTPAQKGAKIAAATGETQLEQATKLRAPAEADAETESKKRQAAAMAGALGPMGDKVTQLVDAAMTRITGQQVEGAEADSGLQLKVNSAAEVLKNFDENAQKEIADLVAAIGANPKDLASLNALNTKLGRTADTALSAAEIPALMAAAPDIVKAAAGTAVTKAVGDKITLEDIGQLGTTQEELASLLGIPAAEVQNLTITDLQNLIATKQQSEFGAAQEVQAGMASSLLSSTERTALRDVLATMEETGLAGAEFQVAQIGKDIAEGRQVTVGNEVYTVEELLSSPAMTDIVKQILDDPEAKTDFVKALKETNPGIYNWVIGSKAGLEKLVSEAATGAGKYRDIQQANLKILAPLDKFRDAFAKVGVNVAALRDVNLAEEVTLPDGTKVQRWQLPEAEGGLPAIAKAVLTAPPEKQATVATSISQLPPGEVAGLDAGQLAALGLDSPTGLWSVYLAEQKSPARNIQNIPNNQLDTIAQSLDWGSADAVNRAMADAILVESLGGPRNPVLDIDVNKNGQFDEADVAALKERTSQKMPSLSEIVATGQVPKVTVPNARDIDSGTGETGNLIRDVQSLLKDGSISEDEQRSLADRHSADTLQAMLDRNPGGFAGAGDIKPSLEVAIQRRVNKDIDDSLRAQGMSLTALTNFMNLPAFKSGVGVLDKDQINRMSDMANRLERAIELVPSNRSRDVMKGYIQRFREYQQRYQEAPEPISFTTSGV